MEDKVIDTNLKAHANYNSDEVAIIKVIEELLGSQIVGEVE
jgi:hypothetical protein